MSGFAPTLLALLDTCATGMGSRWMRHTLHHPLRDRVLLQERFDAVESLAAEGALAPARAVRDALKGCADVERITARISLRSARPRDLSGLRETLRLLPAAALMATLSIIMNSES